MNPGLERIDLETVSAINSDRQAAMRREAETNRALRGPARQAPAGKTVWLLRFAVALCVALPVVLLLARVALAAGAGGGGGGFIRFAI